MNHTINISVDPAYIGTDYGNGEDQTSIVMMIGRKCANGKIKFYSLEITEKRALEVARDLISAVHESMINA